MARKFHKVGNVQMKKDRSGTTIALGNYNKNPAYQTTVEMIVRDAQGNVLAKQVGGFLQVSDPRKRPGITEEQVEKIPEWIKYEINLVSEE